MLPSTQTQSQAQEDLEGDALSPGPQSPTDPLTFGFQTNFHALYKAGKEVGRGQFGTTYECTEIATGALYAVKIISKRALNSREAIEDVRREVKIMKTLNGHENIVRLEGVFEDSKAVYLVMELCTGGELFDAVVARGHYTERDAASLVRQMLRVVAQCHLKGVIHRDIKPENFLFAHSGPNAPLKLTDFGLSEFFVPKQRFTDVVGSAFYLAPEVLRRSYGPPCDVWSVGVIAYILLSGRPPYWSSTETGIFSEILRAQVHFDDEPWPSVSAEAKDLIRKLLAKDPRVRLTAAQGVSHKWLRMLDAGPREDLPLDITVLNSMRSYVGYSKFKRLCLKEVAKTFSDEDLAALRDQFVALDSDGDGNISVTEMLRAIREMRTGEHKQLVIPEDQVQSILQAIDTDNSGTIDYLEFIAAALQINRLERGDRAGWQRHARIAFDKIDKDGNGLLSVQELAAGLGLKSETDISRLLQEADKNGDGYVDFGEFLSFLREQSSVTAAKGPRALGQAAAPFPAGAPMTIRPPSGIAGGGTGPAAGDMVGRAYSAFK